MGCFLGCFGREKDHKRRKQRTNRTSPRVQRNRVQNVNQETISTAEQTITEAPGHNLVAELRIKPEEEEKLSASPRKRVTFNPNITTYEHVLVKESFDSLPLLCKEDVGREDEEELKSTKPLPFLSEVDGSVISSVGSYPPNHRYHNSRDSDDEAEVYGDSDLDDDVDGDNDKYDEHADEESVLIASKVSMTENSAEKETNEEVNVLESKHRSDHILDPIENITQWKDEKPEGMHPRKSQEKLTANIEAPRVSFSSEAKSRQVSLTLKTISEQLKNENQEIGVDASLSKWLVSPDIMPEKKTVSQDSPPVNNFEDRPILGALTADELRQISATSSPRKSPSRSPDEMPIIGTVGAYWSHSASEASSDSVSSYKGLPNTVSKYKEVCME